MTSASLNYSLKDTLKSRLAEQVPLELRQERRWVLWRIEERDGKATKVPYQTSGARASSTDPKTWASFPEALKALDNFNGIGFVLGDGWVGIDLDDCLTAEVPAEVWGIINALDGYAEISPSGRGVHIICRGQLPQGPRRFRVSWSKGVELYDNARYFTVTGQTLQTGDLTHDKTPQLARVYAQLDFEQFTVQFQNNSKVMKLCDGDVAGYPSCSEADLALCSYLLAYTSGDVERADRLFRISKRFRPKWDEKHSSDGRTYGQITLEKAATGMRGNLAPVSAEALSELLDDEFTDRNNARILARLLQGKALYVEGWGWCTYDGRRWTVDHENARVLALARDLLPQHYLERALYEPEKREKLCKAAKDAHSRERLIAALDLARGDLLANAKEFDKDPWLLNCENGVLDLRTGSLLPHSPELMLSKLCPVSYTPQAQAPTWEKFISEITLGDRDLAAFLQRALGYSITGDTREDKLLICWGSGANGKSTLLQTIRRVLGDYAKTIAPDALLRKRGDPHPTAIADLHGVRFAIAIETDEDQFLAEARVKALTGRDAVKARYLHKNYFEFEPQAKIWLATNHRPIIRDTSFAMWRRLALIPFRAFFPPESQDKTLPEKLWREREGILAWLVSGCLAWQREGLREAQAVVDETEAYKSEMDTLQEWLEECCIADPSARTPFVKLYENYESWCKENDQEPLGKRAFGNRLTEKGFPAVKIMKGGRARRGLRLRSEDPTGGCSGSTDSTSESFSELSLYRKNSEVESTQPPMSHLLASDRENSNDYNDIPF